VPLRRPGTVTVGHRARLPRAGCGGGGSSAWAGTWVVHGGRQRPAAMRQGAVAEVTESIGDIVVVQRASARWPYPSLLPRLSA
jgi:hypothetical protein